ncbi:hypothetical protein PAAG_01705 [Paracoccidioides lutzii Pb01]|uniref:Trafficking protein particle complex subunit n=1 Tax=Paracoccidioides lutzii (strain ATCC MYA-826 / Pb01) TaxID=502779 RepID=C1GT60_PARBA|nr:hypothetical protein PAAG_01705 [Paracoccidioides lutzii Pb01]EEH39243.2 hypothetical protein PAAG_01705 [Paracoccidioides lutzii Pb01]
MTSPSSITNFSAHLRLTEHFTPREAEEDCSFLELFTTTMVVYTLIIINKAGGLIYHREFQSGLLKLSTNDYLVLAGTFHGIHAITRSLTPRLPTNSTTLTSTPTTTTPSNTLAAFTSSTIMTSQISHTSTTTTAATGGTGGTSSSTTTPTATPNTTIPNPTLPTTGIEVLETEKFRLTCFQTVTGTKFLLFTDPLMASVDMIMRKIYELYADYVMKNPFYQLEMPVRCEAFDRHVTGWVKGRG